MTVRGHSLRKGYPVEIPEDIVDDSFEPPELSDEEALLANTVPPCLLSLPFILRKQAHGMDDDSQCLESVVRDRLLDQHRRARVDEQLLLLRDFVSPLLAQHAMLFARGLGRDRLCPLLPPGEAAVEPKLFLDYLPLLRVLSVHERSAQRVFDLARENGDDPGEDEGRGMSNNRPRRTRCSVKRGRPHYLEDLSHVLKHAEEEDGDMTPKEVAERLASLCLLTKVPDKLKVSK